ACELVRLFIKAGPDVRVVMTSAACEFVTPLTFQTLSRNAVGVGQFALPAEWKPEHIAYADADAVVVAPATANMIAKMAHGLADDLLSSTLLATRAQVFVAPAMNDGMWDNPATQANIAALKSRGIKVVDPDSGSLACGTEGKGRFAAPDAIFAAVCAGK
ncbi:MAG: bifunctional 4'-phosphopantothenoylcysteine decarboxylase/phosphopantothenoylcysteine synthetase, partial [Kiritimatiellae bacterium]|nr:bifunctional 4'-phosphopantothenoylcysteine decarboxylase/phosphopantothenoylcysteine synthetase [Kiritimatiellia bacterium]